jgi:hypothetical protein
MPARSTYFLRPHLPHESKSAFYERKRTFLLYGNLFVRVSLELEVGDRICRFVVKDRKQPSQFVGKRNHHLWVRLGPFKPLAKLRQFENANGSILLLANSKCLPGRNGDEESPEIVLILQSRKLAFVCTTAEALERA